MKQQYQYYNSVLQYPIRNVSLHSHLELYTVITALQFIITPYSLLRFVNINKHADVYTEGIILDWHNGKKDVLTTKLINFINSSQTFYNSIIINRVINRLQLDDHV